MLLYICTIRFIHRFVKLDADDVNINVISRPRYSIWSVLRVHISLVVYSPVDNDGMRATMQPITHIFTKKKHTRKNLRRTRKSSRKKMSMESFDGTMQMRKRHGYSIVKHEFMISSLTIRKHTQRLNTIGFQTHRLPDENQTYSISRKIVYFKDIHGQ